MQAVKHIVMWNLSGDTEQDRSRNIQKLKDAFEGIRGEIPGLRLLEIGVDFSKVDYACDVVLYSEFDSVEALQGYASHPAHLRVREELGALRIARHQVDYFL
ncbi:Dabb family protein [Phytopseudomonas dryadis]|uniref:Stress responsive protein n=1 Tax=Phytopseudomonas dryadis TaxID=2487520 RepID=A0A4Q9R1H8_9GAMM|nr:MULTISPECIES: Dabb family protein [Pseudomonas]TBU90934.1 stress responsive protein [Pseudomonas dryadis]TBV08911.1 stress responsive protein [Pseudomonas dryadis]TBV15096.1 stress responsive protein [Pseudomonas sp. FRB 230]